MLPIKRDIININKTVKSYRVIEGIVIHWTGAIADKNLADGDGSAESNKKYFSDAYRGASAHYFVDNDSILQIIDDKDIAYHCGTKGTYYHKKLRNSNTLGIEMCVSPGYVLTDKVIAETIELVKYLKAKYPTIKEVVRHYDITHKNCPAPLVSDSLKWNNFLSKCNGQVTTIIPSQNISEVVSNAKYKVRVLVGDLWIRSGPGSNYSALRYCPKGIYTIVETSNGYGRLSSGAGWIYVNNTTYARKI